MKQSLWAVGLGIAFTTNVAMAQPAITPDKEYAKYVGRAGAIEAFSDFGDQVNLRDGSFIVRTTDIELVGTGPTIRITRTFRPNSIAENLHETSGNGFGMWEIEVPRIKTITSNTLGASVYSPKGWQVAGATTATKNARCTGFTAPDRISFPSDIARGWNAWEWWDGYHLVDDSGNDQLLMTRAVKSARPEINLMTIGNWLVGCLPATVNGEPGEAFQAFAPDGTKYWFDYLVYRDADPLQKPLWSNTSLLLAADPAMLAANGKPGGYTPQIVAEFDQLERQYASMLVTRVEDRFGNWVTYHYNTSGRLDSIDASDGRHVGLTFNANGTATVTAGSGTTARTWTYAATGLPPAATHQLTVTRPDGSKWQYALPILSASSLNITSDPTSSCTIDPADYDQFADGTITSPAGAVLTLRVNRKRFARSYVPKECWGGDPTDPEHGYAKYPKEWYAYAVVRRTISGPGLATTIRTYAYAPPVSSWYHDCLPPTLCASTVWTDVTSPDGSRRRSIFSNRYDETENKLLREEDYSPSGQLLSAADYAYAAVANGATNPYPWPISVGNDQQTRTNARTSGQWAPIRQTIITQQGRKFTNTVNTFDALARPLNVTQSSAPSP